MFDTSLDSFNKPKISLVQWFPIFFCSELLNKFLSNLAPLKIYIVFRIKRANLDLNQIRKILLYSSMQFYLNDSHTSWNIISHPKWSELPMLRTPVIEHIHYIDSLSPFTKLKNTTFFSECSK